ncbi:uncharacterized protein LOC130195602 [Pseudoliparis swirei]|uniref:uncharacterized protein LOC130195602 n=1 Tax=Pseudoliparis swirei TaxID=2059687 RepID=UPI0024BE192E|nr:uncharacterized protein LOC130195602 [Pseudoliparis swirei]
MMELMYSPETADSLLLPDPPCPSIPSLGDGESYHVFISYSSTDSRWTHSLIDQLESCGLQVCYHDRDFTPGRTVLENMSDCIQESQKVLLVLSQEFVRSRWCLLEANMSLFRDCLERKPIVPVLLEPGVSVPLHLCHLTYLEADDPDFKDKLLKVLCTPNQQLQGSTVVPFQPPSIYNGKALQPLIAVNEEGLNKWDCGQFSDMEVPDQLRLIIQDPENYRKAVRMINSVSQHKMLPLWVRVLMLVITITLMLFMTCLSSLAIVWMILSSGKEVNPNLRAFTPACLFCLSFALFIEMGLWKTEQLKYIVKELQKAVGQANIILSEEKVLMGSCSNSKIYLVYVSLDGCKREFAATFSEQGCEEDMFQRALAFFSSGYACCLAKRHFPFPQTSSTGHLERGVCFCQYVSQQLRTNQWE